MAIYRKNVLSDQGGQNKTRQIYTYLKKRSTSAEEKHIKSWATTWSDKYIFGWVHCTCDLTKKLRRYNYQRYVDSTLYLKKTLFKIMIYLCLLLHVLFWKVGLMVLDIHPYPFSGMD